MSSAEVNLYYQDLELTGENYLESSLNVSLFKMRKMRNIRLGFSSDKDKWNIIGITEDITEMDPLDLNAIRKYILKEHIFFSITRKTISKDFLLKTFFSEDLSFGYSFSSKDFNLHTFCSIMIFDVSTTFLQFYPLMCFTVFILVSSDQIT